MVKAPFLGWKVGKPGIEIMRRIKHDFDPHNLLNPGKIFGKETRKRVVISRG
ncbi:FAD-linked oxidase C-terminal domain-containing protein [Paenibacillus sinopodophylli]|uniref:FAD-linked oxidase C-terminal domain-containing protein n=1 Tax=Paenibacillus sinopodophylli TaxID=1837342 RepID=UPI00110CFCE1